MFKRKKKEVEEPNEEEKQEEVKEDGGKEEEVKVLSPILKYIFIGLVCFIVILIVGSASINFGVEPTFEIIGGVTAVLAVLLGISLKFDDKIAYVKKVVIVTTFIFIVNIIYVVIKWTGEKVYNDNTLWSPSIIAVLFFAVVLWLIHWFNGSNKKLIISTLFLLIALHFFVLTAIVNGDEQGVRIIFIVMFFGGLVLGWGADKSLKRFLVFNANPKNYPVGVYLFFGLHFALLVIIAVEIIALPITAISKWPLTNWQIVTACVSVPTALYVVYAVWGKKYME